MKRGSDDMPGGKTPRGKTRGGRPEEPPPPSRRSSALFYRLAELQIDRPWLLLALAALLVLGSLSLALRLEVRPGFEALLPETRPSVQELNRVKEKTAGVSTVFVSLEGDDTAALRKAADALVVEVRAIGRPWVGSAESGVHEALDFLKPRVGLYGDLDKLQKLAAKIDERWEYEVGKASDMLLEEEDGAYVPPEITADTLREHFGVDDAQTDRYPDGYYQSPDGKTVIVVVRSAVLGTDYDKGNETLARIEAAVARVDLKSYHPSLTHGLSGDLVSSIAEYNAINEDLTDVGLLGALLIVSVVFLFYMRGRTLLSMVITIGIGVSVTFGFTEFLVGQLNMATGFLFTIIAGNGINSGIIYMARFLEARRHGEDVRTAVRVAHRDTWLPTLTAGLAASAAYASLIVTEFRGFRDFGLIGGVGMIVCWVCTYLFLPSILIIAERVAPLSESRSGLFGLMPKTALGGARFGQPFAAIVARAPRLATLTGVVVTLVAVAATVVWVRNDPMEYDLTNLRTDPSNREDQIRRADQAREVTGHVGYDAMAILVESQSQVPLLVTALEARRDAAPADQKPFLAVHTLQELIPPEQAEKLPILQSIKARVLKSKQRGFIEDEDFEKIAPHLPPDDLKPFGVDELPEGMARAFTEADGRRGRIVYISPLDPDMAEDAHYLFRWADSYRHTELSDGSVVRGSGRAVIFADIWEAIIGDVPKAVMVSLVLTLVVVALAFRKGFALGAVMLSLIAGVAWMTGLLAAGGVRLNFLNFIALPITFGIGVDYAVNVMQRYRREGAGGALKAVRETGGAVVLCSLTTTLGYLALVNSMNHAVRSLGVAAVLGEVACLLTAVIVLPSALVWRDQAKRSRETATAAS